MTTQGQLLTKLERMLNQGKEKDQLIYKILIKQEQQNQEFGQILSQMEPMIGRIVTKIAESVDALLEQLESVDGVAENRKAAEMQKLDLTAVFRAAEADSRERLATAKAKAPDKRGTQANKRKKKKRKRKKNRTKKKSN